MVSGTSLSRNRIAGIASARPPSVPKPASTRLSVSNCATSRPRLAPSAVRTATSRPRAAPRDSSRFARLTQAMSNSAADAREQQDQRRSCLAGDLFPQRHDDHRMRPAKVLRCDLQAQCAHGLPAPARASRRASAARRFARRASVKFVRIQAGNDAGIQMSMSRDGQEVKLPRHHADHFVRLVVDRDRASDDVRRAAEAPLPEPVADDDDAHALVVLVLCEDAPEQSAARPARSRRSR